MSEDNINNDNQQNSNTGKIDTTSYDDIMAAVKKMRNDAMGSFNTDSLSNKRQKLPERIQPPDIVQSTNNNGNNNEKKLPPRVQRPNISLLNNNNTNKNAKTNDNTIIDKPLPYSRITPLEHRERFERNNLNNLNKTNLTIKTNFQTFNQIQVSKSQTGNPLLEYLTIYQMNSKIKDVDYVINSKCIALFLSLRYHKLHPEYIYNKLKKITYNNEDTLRVLLLYVDIEDFQDTIRELDKLCLFNKLTLILAWTNEQCANYLQNLKSVEKEASKRIIQGNRTKDEDVIGNEGKYLERVIDTISSIKSISQSDAKSLLIKFGSMKGIIEANADDLPNIQGLGQLKVDRLLKTFNDPFKNSNI